MTTVSKGGFMLSSLRRNKPVEPEPPSSPTADDGATGLWHPDDPSDSSSITLASNDPQSAAHLQQTRSKEAVKQALLMLKLRDADEMLPESLHHYSLPPNWIPPLANDRRPVLLAGTGALGPSLVNPGSPDSVPDSAQHPLYHAFDMQRQLGPPKAAPLDISPSTRARAIRAKAKLELAYEMIAEFQSGKHQRSIPDDENMDAESKMPLGITLHEPITYNPLQTIRNRAIKKQLSMPYNPHQSGKGAPLVWNIDVSELVSDYAWRLRYYHYMKDRRGRYLYPDSTGSPLSSSHHGRSHSHSHPHSRQSNGHSHNPSSSLEYQLSEGVGSGYKGHNGEDLIQRLRSKLRSSGVTSGDNSDSSWSRSDLSDIDDSGNGERPKHRSSQLHSAAQSRRNSTSPVRHVNVESVKKLSLVPHNGHGKPDSDHPDDKSRLDRTSPSDIEKANGITESSENDSAAELSQVEISSYYSNQLRYLDLVFALSYMQVSNKPSRYYENLNQDTAETITEQLEQLSSSFEDRLNTHERKFVLEAEQEIRKLQYDMSQEHGIRLDSILNDSDRIVGEVNTSLSVEVRNMSSRLDRLERNAPTFSWLWKLGYALLEWTLVGLMWLAWGLVFALGQIKRIFRTICAIIKWVLWF